MATSLQLDDYPCQNELWLLYTSSLALPLMFNQSLAIGLREEEEEEFAILVNRSVNEPISPLAMETYNQPHVIENKKYREIN